MGLTQRLSPHRLGQLAVLAVLALLGFYTHAKFLVLPYAGFEFNATSGAVTMVYVEPPGGEPLAVGDRLVRVGLVAWEAYSRDLGRTLFEGVKPGDRVPLLIEREGQTLELAWQIPGPNPNEIRERLFGVLLVAYIFWLAGLASWLLVRPRDSRAKLLLVFFNLTAVWVVCGSLSAWHLWGSAILLRAAIWFTVPVYIHFHWLFPRPLGRLPRLVWTSLYGLAGALAVAEVFGLLPFRAYLVGFLMALAGSLTLLIAHLILYPDQRRDILLMAVAALVIMLPIVSLSLLGLFRRLPDLTGLVFLALPVLPGAYLYVILRNRPGGMEVRGNRLVSFYLFALLVGTLAALVMGGLAILVSSPEPVALAGSVLAILVAVVSVRGYPVFQRFIENRLLQIPLPPAHLIERYAQGITTSPDRSSLVRLLQEEVLPSLMVRESALLYLQDRQHRVVYFQGVAAGQLPVMEEVAALLDQGGVARSFQPGNPVHPCPWVKLVLPLTLEGQTTGLWLLGRRDPDDSYTRAEIGVMRVLAHQTAITLSNIVKAEQLRALYQADMDRQEAEWARFARWLHDDVLTELSVLKMHVGEAATGEPFDRSLESLVGRIRQVMGGIRPVMLAYGLGEAVAELVDDLSDRAPVGLAIQADLPATDTRYGERVEGHLFRIIQEACENALEHADASLIHVHGDLTPHLVHIVVEDDGVGFETGPALDVSSLLACRHFGLVTMQERALLIGSSLRVDSAPQAGTRVEVILEIEPT